METLVLHKANPIGDRHTIPDFEIRITAELPSNRLNLEQLGQAYELDAEILLDSLSESLPGGTMDRLLALMLKQNASYFSVPAWSKTKELK
jgi:hypothetical protein